MYVSAGRLQFVSLRTIHTHTKRRARWCGVRKTGGTLRKRYYYCLCDCCPLCVSLTLAVSVDTPSSSYYSRFAFKRRLHRAGPPLVSCLLPAAVAVASGEVSRRPAQADDGQLAPWACFLPAHGSRLTAHGCCTVSLERRESCCAPGACK